MMYVCSFSKNYKLNTENTPVLTTQLRKLNITALGNHPDALPEATSARFPWQRLPRSLDSSCLIICYFLKTVF